MNNVLLGVPVRPETKRSILEKIKKYIQKPDGFFQVVSLNPEILVQAQTNEEYKKILATAQIQICDGFGIVLASQILNIDVGERVTGVDLMEELVKLSSYLDCRIALIGGKTNLANRLAECYNEKFHVRNFIGMEGFHDILNPTAAETDKVFSIVADFTPQIILASFGSPAQELWFQRNAEKLQGIVCVGVGGAFNYLSGEIARPPKLVRQIGLEWFFRLLREPWRWRRQLRLFKFLYLVLKQKINTKK